MTKKKTKRETKKKRLFVESWELSAASEAVASNKLGPGLSFIVLSNLLNLKA
jgi:hypothetical protein